MNSQFFTPPPLPDHRRDSRRADDALMMMMRRGYSKSCAIFIDFFAHDEREMNRRGEEETSIGASDGLKLVISRR